MTIERLGPYRIDRRLGYGGMGTVYAGQHKETGDWAAIKVLAENLTADPRFRDRFQSEVEILKRLRHDNIVQLFGFGEEQGRLYYVMELVDGPSLEAELEVGRRFHWRQVVEIAVQVCGALKHAHDHGIIHRDMKPANLLTAPDGRIKLTDFGIAKLFGATGLTMAGSLIGTPDYMAPEQTEGQPATPRSDLYSLGCVMFALMTGGPPFTGSSVTDVIDRVRSAEVPPLRTLIPDVPDALESIMDQLMSKDPSKRPATAKVLQRQLQAMLHAIPNSGSDPGATSIRKPRTQGGASLPTPPEISGNGAVDAAADATRDFTPKEAARFEAGKTDLRETSEQPFDPASTQDYDALADTNSETQLPSHQTRFTPVSNSDRLDAASKSTASQSIWQHRMSIVGLAIAILAIVVASIWALSPPTSDQLYERILRDAAEVQEPDGCADRLDEFLERFPEDRRITEVDRLKETRACRNLQADLERKIRSLTELESLYLKGLDLLADGNTSESLDCFRKIVKRLNGQTADLGATDRRLLERSDYLMKDLQESPAHD